MEPLSDFDGSAVVFACSAFDASTSDFGVGLAVDPLLFLACSGEGLWLVLLVPAAVLLGGIGGFPAKGFKLLFLRKTVCLLPVVLELLPRLAGLLFFPADACEGRGIRDGEDCTFCCLLFFLLDSCGVSFLPGTLVFLGIGGLLFFLTGDCGALLLPLTLFFLESGCLLLFAGDASLFPFTLVFLETLRRGWFKDLFLAGDGSRETG